MKNSLKVRKPYQLLAMQAGQIKDGCLPTNIVKGGDGKWYIVPDLVRA